MNTVQEAKAYIDYFKKLIGKDVAYVDTSGGRRIWLDNCNDEDLIWVANGFLAMEAEGNKDRTQ